jgi:hypothetical protein
MEIMPHLDADCEYHVIGLERRAVRERQVHAPRRPGPDTGYFRLGPHIDALCKWVSNTVPIGSEMFQPMITVETHPRVRQYEKRYRSERV